MKLEQPANYLGKWTDQKFMPSQIQNQTDVYQNEECLSKHKSERKTYRFDHIKYKPGKVIEIRLKSKCHTRLEYL